MAVEIADQSRNFQCSGKSGGSVKKKKKSDKKPNPRCVIVSILNKEEMKICEQINRAELDELDKAQWYQKKLTVTNFKGSLHHWLFLYIIWLFSFQDALVYSKSVSTKQTNSGFFDPIEISPAVLPHNPFPYEPLPPPLSPIFPTRYEPVLTGRCGVNFSAISTVLDRTASDCSRPFATIVGNVICCPQLNSLLHIFQGFHSISSKKLVFRNSSANYCFRDIISILESRGANGSIHTLCSVKPSNLTGGSCPVKDSVTFEKIVNTSKLIEACSSVDALKECCRPVCQPAVMEAALQISGTQLTINENKNVAVPGEFAHLDSLSDCKEVVFAYLASKLSLRDANAAFRLLSSCKVNKVCPLEFKQPTEVIKACQNSSGLIPFCCKSLNSYIAGIQRKMLITNRQAIICATEFGSILRKGGVVTNVFELCDIDLKDFSTQEQQGCLLQSQPMDMIFDNVTGFSLICDLSDNVAAPWPSSSSISSISLCAPEMSLPALPTSATFRNTGGGRDGFEFVVPILLFFVVTAFL